VGVLISLSEKRITNERGKVGILQKEIEGPPKAGGLESALKPTVRRKSVSTSDGSSQKKTTGEKRRDEGESYAKWIGLPIATDGKTGL